MNKIGFLLLSLVLITSCSGGVKESQDILTQEFVMSTYTSENRGINLSNMELTGFVSLNGLAGDEEIANIDISNNTIQVLNISQYSKLLRIIADNNVITYFGDIKYPAEIKFISVANNQLETLDGIEKLTELKTLDVSNNKLDEEDFKKLASLKNLQLIIADGNDVSDEFLGRLQTFNAAYLGSIKQ